MKVGKRWVWWAVGGATALAAVALAVGLVVPPWLERQAYEVQLHQLRAEISVEEKAIPQREAAVREMLTAAGFTVVRVREQRGAISWTVEATRGDFKYDGYFSHDSEYRVRGQKVPGRATRFTPPVNSTGSTSTGITRVRTPGRRPACRTSPRPTTPLPGGESVRPRTRRGSPASSGRCTGVAPGRSLRRSGPRGPAA